MLRLIGNLLGQCFSLLQRTVALLGLHQQVAFHLAQIGVATHAHLGRIERGDGRVGLLVLLVEGRQDAVEVQIARVTLVERPIDGQGIGIAFGHQQRLPVGAVIPEVGRILPVGLFGPLRQLFRVVAQPVGDKRKVGRSVERIDLQGLLQKGATAGGITVNREGLHPLGVEKNAS